MTNGEWELVQKNRKLKKELLITELVLIFSWVFFIAYTITHG